VLKISWIDGRWYYGDYVCFEGKLVVVIWCYGMHTVVDGILCGRYYMYPGLMIGSVVVLYVVMELAMVVIIWCCSMHTVDCYRWYFLMNVS